jgi:hypothetical protein
MPGPKIKCAQCGTVIQSMHRHDWVQCQCKAIFVDGGEDYLRMGFDQREHVLTEDDEPYFKDEPRTVSADEADAIRDLLGSPEEGDDAPTE